MELGCRWALSALILKVLLRVVNGCNPLKSVITLEGWKYYERREDGSLDELLEHDNPFPDSLWKLISPSASTASGKNEIFAALGDWNGDGSLDLVAVTLHMVSLLWLQALSCFHYFLKYIGDDEPV